MPCRPCPGPERVRVADHIAWESLQMAGIFTGFVRREPGLGRFLPRRPRAPQELLERAAVRMAYESCEAFRPQIAAALADHAERYAAPQAARDAALAFAEPDTVAIVTGQQPGLFGGPLYVWHKVATALRLAREIRAVPGAPAVVTVFWNHSEDHDWGEANHTFLLNPALDVQRVRLRLGTTGKPLAALPVATEVALAIDEARDLLPASDAARVELEALAPADERDTLASLTSRALYRHFGDAGLLILDPADLPPRARGLLIDFHRKSEELRATVKAAAAELVDRGFDVTVDPEGPFLFCLEQSGKRRAVADGEAPAEPRLASPGVLLRNVWQDALLPTVAFVAGPGEIAYLALAGAVYERLAVPVPALVPRVSITHAEPRLLQYLTEWQLQLPDLERGAKAVEEWIAARAGAEATASVRDSVPEEQLRALAGELRERLRAIEPSIAEVDPNLRHPLARIGSRTASELEKFVQKLANQRRNLAGRYRQHARRLCGQLMPRGRLQERVFPALPFLVRYGATFVSELIEVADPWSDAHLLVAGR